MAFATGTGGSCLIIGSAAGVAAMGMLRIEFFWYLRRIAPLALAGYLGGALLYLLLSSPWPA
jgi:Na+/H+ antiporter NhaD/arsenite permease-like protein